MARQILPIVGSEVGGYFGGLDPKRLNWWRRALNHLRHACLRASKVPSVNINFVMPGSIERRTQRQIAEQARRKW